jgi:hypothetical protein
LVGAGGAGAGLGVGIGIVGGTGVGAGVGEIGIGGTVGRAAGAGGTVGGGLVVAPPLTLAIMSANSLSSTVGRLSSCITPPLFKCHKHYIKQFFLLQ